MFGESRQRTHSAYDICLFIHQSPPAGQWGMRHTERGVCV